MNGFLDRLGAAFLSEAPPRAREASAPDGAAVAAPAAIALLCGADDAWAVGGGVALAAARTAVLAAWGAPEPPAVRAPATPAARRLAAALARRDHDARASGRLVHVPLRGTSAEACAEAARVAAAAGDVPCVVVLAGPRDERVDALLRARDRVLIHAPTEIADLAVESVASLGVPAEALPVDHASPTARALAALGFRAPGSGG